MDRHVYEVNLVWTSGRKGILSSPEIAPLKDPDLEVATPPQFPKGVAGIWSPEHLFTAAVSSCLMTTFLSIAENSGLAFSHFSCHAAGKLEQVDGKLRMTAVLLEPLVIIADERDQTKTIRILQKAEAACLISNSVTAAVTMTPRVDIAAVKTENF